MHAAHSTERCDTERSQIAARPHPIGIDEAGCRILHERIRAPCVIARGLERGKRLADPAPFRRPVRDRLGEPSGAFQQVTADRRVVWKLHLVDRHAVWSERNGLAHAVLPIVLGLAQHARDQIDIDLSEVERARLFVGTEYFG